MAYLLIARTHRTSTMPTHVAAPFAPAVRLLLLGATGAVGSEVLRMALAHPQVQQVVAPTRRALPEATMARTHSAPVRLLPQPRPARMSQVRQSPGGGSWSGRAQIDQSRRTNSATASAAPS